MKLKDGLRPTMDEKVMHLVRAAGVDVSPWANSKNGPVKSPSSNPAYCYNWAFIQPNKIAVLNLWFDDIRERGDRVWYWLNPKQRKSVVEKAKHLSEYQRRIAIRRLEELENALIHVQQTGATLRVIVGDGTRKDLSDPASVDATRMTTRLLDPQTWHLEGFDSSTGRYTLVRGDSAVTTYSDQHDTESGPPNRQTVTSVAWKRESPPRHTDRNPPPGR